MATINTSRMVPHSRAQASASPVLFGLARCSGCPWIFGLHPMPPGAIRRAESFRDDAFTAKATCLAKNNRAVLFEMLIEYDAQMRAAQ